jgi:uncharacterized protein YqfB (UPF0267 family)
MTFASFAKLKDMGISRPSLAPIRFFYFSKLYSEKLSERKGQFTSIRLRSKSKYELNRVIPIYLDDKGFKLFDARVTGVTPIEIDDIGESFAKGDADMTLKEFRHMMKKLFPVKYGKVPKFNKISLQVVEK